MKNQRQAQKNNDFKIIKEKLNDKYKLELKEDLSLIALQGPGAKNVLGKVIPEIDNQRFMHGREINFNNFNNVGPCRSPRPAPKLSKLVKLLKVQNAGGRVYTFNNFYNRIY